MNVTFKILLIVGVALLLMGAVVFCVALAEEDWDFSRLSDTTVEPRVYTEPEGAEYDRVELYFSNTDIQILFLEDAEHLTVEYPYLLDRAGRPKAEITLTEAENGVTIKEQLLWYRNLFSFFNYQNPKVIVKLPIDRSYHLNIFTDNGDIELAPNTPKEEIDPAREARTRYVHLSSDNGSIWMLDSGRILCESDFRVHTDNGRITLGTVQAEAFYCETDNGGITLEEATANAITLLSDNGDVEVHGALRADQLTAQTGNGDVRMGGAIYAREVEVRTGNGRLQLFCGVDADVLTLRSGNGDIRANVAGKRSEYNIDIKDGNGDSNVSSQVSEVTGEAVRTLVIKSGNGDVEIQFLGALMENS